MPKPTEDMLLRLMAMADGELSAAEAAEVARQIEADADLKREFQQFVVTSRQRLGGAFESMLTVPADLRANVDAAAARVVPASAAAPKTDGAAARVVDTLAQLLTPLGFGLAAAAALWLLAIGIAPAFRGGTIGEVAVQVGDHLDAAGAVATALSTSLSGSEREVAQSSQGPVTFRLVQSFKDTDGRLCREYESQLGMVSRQHGIACREQEAWRVIALIDGKALAQTGGPAAGGGSLDGLIDDMRDGEPLTADDERRLISGDWRGK